MPHPEPQLWQDCPYVPFDDVQSDATLARITTCRPHSSMQEAGFHNGLTKYAHCSGDFSYHRQYPFQIANTMAFVLNKKN